MNIKPTPGVCFPECFSTYQTLESNAAAAIELVKIKKPIPKIEFLQKLNSTVLTAKQRNKSSAVIYQLSEADLIVFVTAVSGRTIN